MIVVLPLVSFVFIMLCFIAHGTLYRKAFLSAAIIYGMLLTAATEILSLFNLITYASLSVFWGFVAVTSISCFIFNRNRLKATKLPSDNLLIYVGIGVILTTTFIVAIISPPNNWDSMTYHMSRVMHWIQNKSVAHYPTGIIRQLYPGPWAEYAVMHLQILSNGDYFANLVQWFAMCGSIIGVTLIARDFGASGYIQTFAAVIAATIPMGILQASSTQNDYTVSFWLIGFVYFGMLLVQNPTLFHALAAGGSLGLAILTKGTAYIYAFPFVIWLLLTGLKMSVRNFVKYALVISAVVISLNAGFYLRNYSLWGNPLSTEKGILTNEHKGISVFISNLSRNIALHTWTPDNTINMAQYRGIEYLHRFLGIDMNDPKTTFGPEFKAGNISLHEDFAGNGIHLILILFAIPAIVLRERSLRPVLYYSIALIGGYSLFCILLKWQAWGSRLQLPFFVLATPLIAVAVPCVKKKRVVTAVMAVLLLASTQYLFKNESRPLLGDWTILTVDRERLYFVNRPAVESYYFKAADYFGKIRVCKDIAIYSSSVDAYEYPFWILLSKRSDSMPRIEHVNVHNISGTIMLRDFQPCALFELPG